jgi:N6-adenosine-specific RNA methylase IME4
VSGVHLTERKRYRTIVADPPWRYGKFNGFSTTGPTPTAGKLTDAPTALPYDQMSVEDICALPVGDMATEAAHLYLWTTQRYLWDARQVVETWGFKPSTLLTWCKPPMGSALGFAFAPTTEFVVFAHRGGLQPIQRWESTWFGASRPYVAKGGPTHSAKPDAFLDIVEQVSPGPYLELFARRARFGWDYWGNESLGTAEMAA